jgi:chemotaxis protein methyltransferase CheR
MAGMRMETSISEELFHSFSKLIYSECGINLREGKKSLLQARLNKRLRAVRMHTYREYYDYLTSVAGSNEMFHFLDSISTNLTYFFRESQHFDFLSGIGLRQLLERKAIERSNRIRFWSAGCSTGEEPYSLAMCVLEELDTPGHWDFRILATDISTRVLEQGARGLYPRDRIEKVPPSFRSRYFRKSRSSTEQNSWEVHPYLKEIVTFRRLNLQDSYPFTGQFDCIFCRNVMIYFDKKTQEKLVNRMSEYLNPGGYFFVGHSESLTGLKHSLRYVKPAVYCKQ